MTTDTTITRRTALAGTVTLPAAMAPLGLAQAAPTPNAEPDPFILALRDFIDAETAYSRSFDLVDPDDPDGHKVTSPYCAASAAARRRMAEAQPTTALGVLAMIQALVPMVGEPKSDAPEDIMNIDAHDLTAHYGTDVLAVYVRNLITAAERILNGNEEAV